LVKLLIILVKLINYVFILNPQEDEQCTGETGGQSDKVDEKRTLVAHSASIKKQKVVPEHWISLNG
jgi:hypothetical protein